jgi:cob(I)alamin adenosyltransferase
LGEGGRPVRVSKAHPLIEFLGSLDEANSFLGLARSFISGRGEYSDVDEALAWLQRVLFNVGFSVTSGEGRVSEERLRDILSRAREG